MSHSEFRFANCHMKCRMSGPMAVHIGSGWAVYVMALTPNENTVECGKQPPELSQPATRPRTAALENGNISEFVPTFLIMRQVMPHGLGSKEGSGWALWYVMALTQQTLWSVAEQPPRAPPSLPRTRPLANMVV
jgi:hypothetical protein